MTMTQSVVAPTTMYEDIQSAISNSSKNPQHHGRTKHIDIKFHFIREPVENKTVTNFYYPTENMLADIYTQPLCLPRFIKLCLSLGVCSM